MQGVVRYRKQHPKIRMFSRLIGVDDTMTAIPRTAADFYMALLNRVHARAGPLVSEAVEGFSFVRCRVVSRVAREMLRSPFRCEAVWEGSADGVGKV